MSKFFSTLNDRRRLFAFVFLIAVGGLIITLFGKGIEATLAMSAGIGLILFIARPIWFSSRYGETAVRLMSLGVSSVAVLAFVGWPQLLENYLKPFLKERYPDIQIASLDDLAIGVFIFLAVVIYIVNNFRSDHTGMGVHSRRLEDDIPEPSFKDRLRAVCGALTDDLKSIDTKTNWSARYFTPLDAEVEINTRNGKERKVTDLLKAIRNSKKRMFLVLGIPGAGKSVALRKLCQDLAAEVDSTQKIPVYINLREWHVEEKWSEENPPTVEQLYDFIFRNLKERDIVTSKFFDKYFERLYETGRLYFVLDSFDEIPAVLDEKENSELIHQLSEVIFKFLKGARQEEAQGILASRLFRKPTHEFQAEVTLEIRPFTEQKIISTFEKYGILDQEIIKDLFRDRPELVPLARNPFSAILIAEYVENNQNALPPNQSEMYADYFNRTLDSCSERLERKGISKEDFITYTIEIASAMFKHYGLEASVPQLAQDLPEIPVEDCIDILKFARLGRLGAGDDSLFSFSHRRFTEYFSVQKLIAEDADLDLQAIPTDSQWRDALVLYCEVAPEEKATAIAEFCWNTISSIDNPQDMRVIHSMRFLRDAFQGRSECTSSFQEELYTHIDKLISPEQNIISSRISLELGSLLRNHDIDSLIRKTLQINNPLLNETTINTYRNLPRMSAELKEILKTHFSRKSLIEINKESKQLAFALSLSEAFSPMKRAVYIDKLIGYTLITSSLILLHLIPSISIISLITITTLSAIRKQSSLYAIENIEKYHIANIILLCVLFTLLVIASTNPNDHFKQYLSDDFINIASNIFFYSPAPLNTLTTFILTASIIALSLLASLRPQYSKNEEVNPSSPKIEISELLAALRPRTKTILTLVAISTILLLSSTYFIIHLQKIEHTILLRFSVLMILISLSGLIILKSLQAIREVTNHNTDKKWLKHEKLSSRENIYHALKKSKSLKTRRGIINHLERNTDTMTGSWPDPSILAMYKTDEISTRLARLEEKWLGLDR